MIKENERFWDWTSATVLTLMVIVCAVRLDATQWTDSLSQTQISALLGTSTGLAIGFSQFQRRSAIWLGVLYTIVFSIWQLITIAPYDTQLQEQITSVLGRISISLSILFSGSKVEDTILFIAGMIILFWGVGLFSGYQLTRKKNTIASIAPSFAGIVIIQFYDYAVEQRIAFIGFYLFLCLLLISRINFMENTIHWEKARVFLGSDAKLDIKTSLWAVSLGVVLLAWNLPLRISPYEGTINFWQEMTAPMRNDDSFWDDALASVNGEDSGPGKGAGDGSGAYGNNLSLGHNVPTNNAPIFEVTAPNNSRLRYYWRIRSYDQYVDNHWVSSYPSIFNFLPDEEDANIKNPLETSEATRAEFTFSFLRNSENLINIQQPYWLSRNAQILFTPAQEDAMDIIGIRASPAIKAGETYTVFATLTEPTILELREAGTRYPAWVEKRYMYLSEDISPRIVNLAEEITAGKTTPYDKAAAITDYLRNNMTYETSFPEVPQGYDPIEWFLFTHPSGFCNYYASAEVLLLRAVGVPARLSVGYAQGTFSQGPLNTSKYRVTLTNSHAWPEVYFPNIGWVEFEPTTNEDALIRPLGTTANPDSGSNLGGPRFLQEGEDALAIPGAETLAPDQQTAENNDTITGIGSISFRYIYWVIITLIIFLLSIIVWQAYKRINNITASAVDKIKSYYSTRRRPMPYWLKQQISWLESSPHERAFHTINQSLKWIGRKQESHATPAERAAILSQALPRAKQDIEILLKEFQAEQFSPERGDLSQARRASLKIKFYTLRNLIERLV